LVFISFQCSAHFYHLAVSFALKAQEKIHSLIGIVRQWTASTHRSHLATLLTRFQTSEGLPTTKIPIDVATRWNSTFMMLESFNANKKAIIKTEEHLREVLDTDRRPQEMTPSYWNSLRRLATNLKPIVRDDFVIINELCKILKIFHVETCRVFLLLLLFNKKRK
jgi:hypothetical protein